MERINRIFFILLVITSILSLTITVISQGPATTIQSSSLSYNAKVGDSTTYQVIKASYQNMNYLTGNFGTFPNGTYISFNITVGTQFTIKIVRLNNTGIPDIFYNESLSLPGKAPYNFPFTYANPMNYPQIIQPGFNSKTTAEQYYNSSSASILNYAFYNIFPLVPFSGNGSTHVSGDFIALTYARNFLGGANGSYFLEFNWKTGWLESINLKASYTNGTIIEQYQLQQEPSSNSIESIISFSTNPIGLIGIFGLIIIIGVIGFAYTKYHGQVTQGALNESFPKYLQEKMKFSKRKKIDKNKTPMDKADLDKSLEMIDEIIQENKPE